MWYEILDNNLFIKKLYNQVPTLTNINIYNIRIHDEGNRMSIVFELPYYVDFPPKKWIDAQYSKVIVQVDFCAIQDLFMDSSDFSSKVTIVMIKDYSNELITINVTGSMQANIIAETGSIQFIKGYKNKPEF